MRQIIGSNNKVARIEIGLPVDINGEAAFDEDGEPVKGKTPIVFTVPRFDAMADAEAKAVSDAVDAARLAKSDDGSEKPLRERSEAVVLAMLRNYVTDRQFEVLSGLRLFELQQIAEVWQEDSELSLGELLASPSS